MGRRLIIIISLLAIVAATSASGFVVNQSGLLWRVVQTCLVSHRLTGASFPCLLVDTAHGRDSGYAVIRAPLDETHIVVSPTVRTVGIEADRLRGGTAPNYFEDAWEARHFVTDTLERKPAREDLALAVNSRIGRSQDQLHIHVDCVRRDVKASLDRQRAAVNADTWTRVEVLPQLPHYWGLVVPQPDLEGINVFDLAARGLELKQARMHDLTIVVVGTKTLDGKPGFLVLARTRVNRFGDLAHGEALLDHQCSAFR